MQNENNDLISREALKKAIGKLFDNGGYDSGLVMNTIDNAPTVTDHSVELVQKSIELGRRVGKAEEAIESQRPQGEYVDISKLRLMTVEECAGHTIDYAMGWKACIEWIKGGAV